MTVDTSFIELMPWAQLAVERCVALQPGEEALVIVDTRSQEYRGAIAFAQALMASVSARGGEPNLIVLTPRHDEIREPPRVVASAMRAADVIFTLLTEPLTQTQAMYAAREAGARVLLFGGAAGAGRADDMLFRLAPRSAEALDQAGGLAAAIARALAKGRRVQLTSPLGTDLSLTVGDLEIIAMTGRCDRPGDMQFYVPGLVNAGVTPGSASGRVVFDSSLMPLPGPLPGPVAMTVRDGYVVDVEGGPAADTWRGLAERLADPGVYAVSEFGLGANRQARLLGNVVEEDAVYGVAHVGLGTDIAYRGKLRAAWHVEGCLTGATVEVGGHPICVNGEITLDPLPLNP
jgi:leucyl aminopeptidase (aminopeptidase T)